MAKKRSHFSSQRKIDILKDMPRNVGVKPAKLDTSLVSNYNKSRGGSYQLFAQTDQKLGEKLESAGDHAKAVREGLKEIFEPNPNLSDAFEVKAKRFNQVISQRSDLDLESVVASMVDVESAALQALQTQQKAEMDALTTRLDDEIGFKKSLCATLGIGEDDTGPYSQIKDQFMNTLQNKHNEESKQIQNHFAEKKSQMLRDTKLRYDELIFISLMLEEKGPTKFSQTTRDRVRAAIRAAAPKDADTSATVSQNDSGRIELHGITLSDIEKKGLETIHGRKIDVKPDPNNPKLNTYTIEHGRFDNRHIDSDYRTIAELIKAKGHSHITMTLDYKHPEVAKDRAKQTLKACLEAGFPPENIKIVMNGKELKIHKDPKSGETARNDFIELVGQAEYQELLLRHEKAKSGVDQINKYKDQLQQSKKVAPPQPAPADPQQNPDPAVDPPKPK